jgi:hypothetical protein
MKNTKFVVRMNRRGALTTQYMQRVDLTPIQMTPERKLALVMGRFTVEDAVKSLQNSGCTPELISVQVTWSESGNTNINRNARNPFGSRASSVLN